MHKSLAMSTAKLVVNCMTTHDYDHTRRASERASDGAHDTCSDGMTITDTCGNVENSSVDGGNDAANVTNIKCCLVLSMARHVAR